MRYLKTLTFLSLCLFMFVSCETEEATLDTKIDLQSWFDADRVRVLWDGKEIFDEEVSTIEVLGVATAFNFTTTKGDHELEVILNKGISKKETITLTKQQYIGVNYDFEREVFNFIISDEPFVYD